MEKKNMIIVNVLGYDLEYKKIDGAYTFISIDSRLKGLCVMTKKSYDAALKEAMHQIKVLEKHNQKVA